MRTTMQPHPISLSLQAKACLVAVASIAALAVVVLIFSASTAATATGAAPDLAITLASEMSTGILAPGEQRWYKFDLADTAQGEHVEQSLTLFFTPGDGNQVRQMSLQLFEAAAVDQANLADMSNFGAGQLVSRDNNPRSGELFWNGWLFGQQNYYIQLVNNNEIPIDYWLLTDDVVSYPIDPMPEGVAEVEPPLTLQPVADGGSPQMAVPFQLGRNQGQLAPGQERWYSFSIADTDAEYFEETALTMFATPNEAQQIQNFTFDVFTAEEVQRWSGTETTRLNNVGAGSLTRRDEDPLTGERFWTGWVVDRGLYYIRVQNGADQTMDYWLFAGDIYNPALGVAQP